MDRFSLLLSQLTAEHKRLLQECEELRSDAEAWRAQGRRDRAQRGIRDGEDARVQSDSQSPVESLPDDLCVDTCSAPPHLSDDLRLQYEADDSSDDSIEASSRIGKMVTFAREQSATEDAHRPDQDECARCQAGSAIWAERRDLASGEVASALTSHGRWRSLSAQGSTTTLRAEVSCHSNSRDSLPQIGINRKQPSAYSECKGSLPSTGSGKGARSLSLRARWLADLDEAADPEAAKLVIAHVVRCLRSSSTTGTADSESKGCVQVLVVRPSSRIRIVWDSLCVIMLSYDVMSIPMLAFATENDAESDESSHKQVLHIVTMVFWTIDIVFSFLTGFYNGGVVEVRLVEIARHYLRGWFAFDLPIVALDWVVTILFNTVFQEVVGAGRVVKVLRISRVLRLFRLLRMLKLPLWARRLGEVIRLEFLVTFFGVIRSLVIIALANHFIACAWYLVGGHCRPFTWVQVLDEEKRDLKYRYATALHWSVTQFTPASMEVVPRNFHERVFAIAVIFSGMVAFSCFVSSITQAMGNLQRAHMERDTQMNQMRRYITENRISLELGYRITVFLRTHETVGHRRVHERDIQIFKFLPPSLRQELRCEVYWPILCKHPLLKRSLSLDDTLVQEVCQEAMHEISLGRGEELFHPGQDALFAFFIQSGMWQYRPRSCRRRLGYSKASTLRFGDSSSCSLESQDTTVGEGEKFICEVALWLQWEMQGYLVATTVCEGTSLNSETFGDIAGRKPHMVFAFREYAGRFHKQLEGREEAYAIELGLEADVLDVIVQESMDSVDEACMTPAVSDQGPRYDSESGTHPPSLANMWRSILEFGSEPWHMRSS